MTIFGWLNEQWLAIPKGVREPIKSFTVASVLGLQSTTTAAFAVGYGLGLCNTPESTLHFFSSAWWGILIGTFFGLGPYYRAAQGSKASQTVVTSPPNPLPHTLAGP